jgi:hypothetical protein
MLVGDDLTIALFLVGTGVSVAGTAMSAAGWKHPALIYTLIVIGIVMAAIGLGWPYVKAFSPVPVVEIIQDIARSPVAWFVVAMMVLITVLRRPRRPRRDAGIPAPTEAPSTAASATVPSSYIKEMTIRPGSVEHGLFPHYAIRFAKNGKDARVLIEFSAFVNEAGGGWTARRTVTLGLIETFARDEVCTAPLLSSDTIESMDWRWGGPSITPPTQSVGGYIFANENLDLMPRSAYRGRLVFIDSDGHETRRYFIVTTHHMAVRMPNVITRDAFDFIAEWEAT